MPTTLLQSDLAGLDLLHRGKVRDVYALSAEELLIVATAPVRVAAGPAGPRVPASPMAARVPAGSRVRVPAVPGPAR